MRMSKIVVGSICLAAASFTPSLPARGEQADFRMSGVVRTICRLEIPGAAAPQSSDVIDFGSFYQLCNARNGYRVTMRHPANMQDATLFWDGRAVPLSPGNETVIADESQAAVKYSDVHLDLRGAGASVHSLSFRIDPKGATY